MHRSKNFGIIELDEVLEKDDYYMEPIHITKQEARDIMCRYHFINTDDNLKGLDGIKQVFTRLKSIQYDPLDVVGRNSDLVLQARVKNYKRNQINELLYKERYLIDGWDKMMGIYQTSDFPYMEKIRVHRSEIAVNILKHRLQIDALEYQNVVLDILKEEPKFSSEISIGESTKHRWGHTKPSSATLDYLFHRGKIGIRKRRSTQKQYDLIENLISNTTPYTFDSEEAFVQYYLLRRIKTMGLVSNKNGVHFSGLHIDKKTVRSKYFKNLIEDCLIVPVKIDSLPGEYYILKDALQLENEVVDKVTFLAPLDNMIWDRELMKKVFEFEYTWEVYTPVVKRKYGYYVLPMIYKSNFIGRIEFQKHRNNEELEIKKIWYEDSVTITKSLENKVNAAIKRFSKYIVK